MTIKKSNTKLEITPLGDRVLVKPVGKESKTESGIIIPDTVSQEKPDQGKVIAVGDGRVNDDGKIIPLRVKKGDKIIFSKYGPDEVTVDGEEYYIISEASILAVIK